MNATAMLSRMFDRWYRRQMARQHLLAQVRLAGKRIDAAPSVQTRADLLQAVDRAYESGSRTGRDG